MGESHMNRLGWRLVGVTRRAARRAHIRLHRLFCCFGIHRPVGAIVYLPSGKFFMEKSLCIGEIPFQAAGNYGLERCGRYYIPTGADQYGQRDSSGPIQEAMNAAWADKREWCEFCNELLSEGSTP